MKVCVKKSVDFSFKFFVMTGVGVMGFAEPAEKRCIKFNDGGFVVVNPDVFFVEQFEGWFLNSSKRQSNRGPRPEHDLHPVVGRGIFKVVFEIVGGPRLLEFFQAEYFVALASLNVNRIFMGFFCLSNKVGNFGNTGMLLLGFSSSSDMMVSGL